MKNKNLGFARWYRRGVEGVSKVEHGSARWGQGVICGVEVSPGQPVGQVGLEPLHFLFLLLEEQLCTNQTFISCPLILPTGRREEERWCQNSCVKKLNGNKTVVSCVMPREFVFYLLQFFFAFFIKEILKSSNMGGNMSDTMCLHTIDTKY